MASSTDLMVEHVVPGSNPRMDWESLASIANAELDGPKVLSEQGSVRCSYFLVHILFLKLKLCFQILIPSKQFFKMFSREGTNNKL